MASLAFPILVLAAVCIFHTETVDSKALSQSRDKRAPPFPDDIKEIVSLDPRLKEEYVKIFLELFKEEVEKNPSLSENFFAYPRQGKRAMNTQSMRANENFFSWPRQGKRQSDDCCSGVVSILVGDDVMTTCDAMQCCNGLEQRMERAKDSKIIFFSCVPSQYSDSSDKLES